MDPSCICSQQGKNPQLSRYAQLDAAPLTEGTDIQLGVVYRVATTFIHCV